MKRTTVPSIVAKKEAHQPIVMVTCYDATFAKLIAQTEVDIVLVGDSLGMVIQGGDNTVSVTLEDILYHTRAVARGCHNKLIVADLPFMSYQASVEQALLSAGRCLKEANAHAIKMEGGMELVPIVRKMTKAGIPVMGHIGLKPQQIHCMGGYKIQGKTEVAIKTMLHEALSLEKAGCFSLVLEGMDPDAAAKITKAVKIPTIGIAAGPDCDGQVLVLYDLLGLDPCWNPDFAKQYLNGAALVSEALTHFVREVRNQNFPLAKKEKQRLRITQ